MRVARTLARTKIAAVPPTTRSLATPVAWLVWVVTFTIVVLTILSVQAVGDRPLPSVYGLGHGFLVVGSTELVTLVYATVGALLIQRRLDSRIGWLVAGIGLGWAIQGYAVWYTAADLLGVVHHPGAGFAAWVASWSWLPGQVGIAAVLPLFFPDGRLPSQRWGWALGVSVAGILLGTAALALQPGPLFLFPGVVNPYSGSGLATLAAWISRLSFLLMGAGVVLAAASVAVRYRTSQYRERQQLKWFAYAAAVAALAVVTTIVLRATFDPSADLQLIVVAYWLSLGALPVAIGIAVLRHRLYDIDVLISRTFVYGSLLALAAGVYSASIRLFQYLFVQATGNKSDFAFVISTLILGAAFLPARKRLEQVADRWFNRRERKLDVFAEHVELVAGISVIDPPALARRLLNEAMGALGCSAGEVRLQGKGGDAVVAARGELGNAPLTVPIATSRMRVGSISLEGRPRGATYTSAEIAALTHAAVVVAAALAPMIEERAAEPSPLR